MTGLLAIAAGGAIGSVARYLLGGAIMAWTGPGFPWGTLAVNAIGGVVAGGLIEGLAQGLAAGPAMRAFLFVGLLGGFTTFSAFAVETVRLMESDGMPLAAAYVVASVALSVGGVVAGFKLVRWLGG